MIGGRSVALLLTTLLAFQGCSGRTGYGPGEQEYGHINVRNGANMFYWLFYVQNDNVQPTDVPTVIWLQGGPGADSTGYGNFMEIGPLHANGSARTTTWAKQANILFIDNPVGTGFSYVNNVLQLATTNEKIGNDMVAFLKAFFNLYPTLAATPLYIFCESYGGKMTVEIAKQLDQAVKNGEIGVDFRGVALGDSWISPMDSVNTWAPFLLQTGVVDQNGYNEIAAAAAATQQAVDRQQWTQATNAWGNTEGVIGEVSGGVDFYNILYKTPARTQKAENLSPLDRLYRNHVSGRAEEDDVNRLMETDVRTALGVDQSISFGGQSGAVFNALSADFMKPVTSVVEDLLQNTDLVVAVLTGQLDLIVDTPGTVQWVDRLNWSGSNQWKTASRQPLAVNGNLEGYVKNVGKLYLYWINRSGHMIPTDNPDTSLEILNRILSV